MKTLAALGLGLALWMAAGPGTAEAAAVPSNPVAGAEVGGATGPDVMLVRRRGGGGGHYYRGYRGYRGGWGGSYFYSSPSCWWSRRYHRWICSY